MVNFLLLLLHFNELTALMTVLVLFIALCVINFARFYMKGDSMQRIFFLRLTTLISSTLMMISADNLLLFFLSWCLSNIILTYLMVHKPSWSAAKASGILSAKNYLIGAICIASAFTILYLNTQETSISIITKIAEKNNYTLFALLLLLIGAMTQSAIWPFHKWLLSSLNSPTPVSAIMHAGLVNGGGFLLIRFAPLYLQYPVVLYAIFAIGMITALLGTLWKLMQSDVKRMLACSTIGQMGFMFAQCGIGLFSAAAAHLILHGTFKAYLFMASGNVALQKRLHMRAPNLYEFTYSLICGAAGSYSFAYFGDKPWIANNTSLVLVLVAFITSAQLSLPLLFINIKRQLFISLAFVSAFGMIYGISIKSITTLLSPIDIMQPQELSLIYITGMMLLSVAWLFSLFFKTSTILNNPYFIKQYVVALNASQPDSTTITAERNQYQY
jgi:NAD(P)H-quinone oxidoreductase subunit 5